MNKSVLVGRLVKDPEIKNVNETKIAGFTLAVDRGMKDANGNKQADFIPCVAFKSSASFLESYCKKGNLIGVVGRLQTRTYTDKDGANHFVMEVIADSVENYTPRDSAVKPSEEPKAPTPKNTEHRFEPYPPQDEATEFEVTDDDLPW